MPIKCDHLLILNGLEGIIEAVRKDDLELAESFREQIRKAAANELSSRSDDEQKRTLWEAYKISGQWVRLVDVSAKDVIGASEAAIRLLSADKID